MHLTIYQNHVRFLERVLPFLEEHEGSNHLMLGIALNIERYLAKCQPYMVVIDHAEAIIAVALQTPPHNIVIYADDQVEDDVLLLLINHLIAIEQPLPGVIGPKVIAFRFSNLWFESTGRSVEPGMSLRSYQLTEVTLPQGIEGSFRPATLNDQALLCSWHRAFYYETSVSGPVPDSAEWADRVIANEQLFIWEVNGIPVSMAVQTRPTRRSRSISAVYTPPEHRRNGYASACVAHLSQLILDSGYEFAALFTDLKNPTSNKIYMAIGYVPVCDVSEYTFS